MLLRLYLNGEHHREQSTFKKLLDKDNSFLIHSRNLQTQAMEIFKVTKGLTPDIFSNVFNARKELNYNLLYASNFVVPLLNSVYNGTESILFMGPEV